jgi:hypothetical protein
MLSDATRIAALVFLLPVGFFYLLVGLRVVLGPLLAAGRRLIRAAAVVVLVAVPWLG